MAQKLNFLILDDHLIVRKGLTYLLKESYPGSTVDIASNEKKLLAQIKNSTYDLLILDLNLPDFEPLSLIPTILVINPNINILVYSMYSEKLFAKRVLHIGAKGYLEKRANEKELFRAVDLILNGGVYVSPQMTHSLLNGNGKSNGNGLFEGLSDREFEVLLLIVRGHSPKEVSKILNVHSSTVGTYKTRIFQKLNVRTIVELLQLARNHGIA